MNSEVIEDNVAAKKTKKRLLLVTLVVTALLAAITAGVIFNLTRVHGPVPDSISKSVNFPVYYPDTKSLSTGYILDVNSFKASSQAVVFVVTYDNGKRIVFTEQAKPSDTIISSFASKAIPLHTDVETSVGRASLGTIGLQTVAVSLPTNDKTWVLITAPKDINQTSFKQLLGTLRK